MTVSLGTVASAKANSSLAPWRMIPPYSCWLPGQHRRLVGDDSHRAAIHARKADHHVFSVVLLDFEEIPLVHDPADDLLHVIGQVGLCGNDGVESGIGAVDRIARNSARRVF